MVGITGPPASGKSTLAEHLVRSLEPIAALVPMDGFHLADSELRRLGIHARKGAPETFDAGGFVSTLDRLRRRDEAVVYAPEFRREIETAVAGAIAVPRDVPVVVTEGNYLLVESPPWGSIRPLLDETWFIDLDDEERIPRLVRRHVAFGRDPAVAESRARGVDQENADAIRSTRHLADLVIESLAANP